VSPEPLLSHSEGEGERERRPDGLLCLLLRPDGGLGGTIIIGGEGACTGGYPVTLGAVCGGFK